MLRQRWPEAEVTGLDNSAEMIAAAALAYPAEKCVSRCGILDSRLSVRHRLLECGVAVAADHAVLFAHLMAQVASPGVLAVQMPYHYESPLHYVVQEVANDRGTA